jgi:hypothetical protein
VDVLENPWRPNRASHCREGAEMKTITLTLSPRFHQWRRENPDSTMAKGISEGTGGIVVNMSDDTFERLLDRMRNEGLPSRGRLGRFSAMIGDAIKPKQRGGPSIQTKEPERWVWLSGLAPFSFAGRPHSQL